MALSRSAIAVVVGLCLATAVGSVAFAGFEAEFEAPQESPGDILRGDEAVERLEATGTLDEVAAEAGMHPDDLVAEFGDDPTLFLTETGFVGYEDRAVLSGETLESPPSASLTTDSSLASRPGSSRTIFLDFDGHTTTDSTWGASVSSPIVSAPAGLSDAVVFEVWQRVSEDYLPFDINVTTIDPGVEALRKSRPTDGAYGVRVVISPTYFASYAPGTLGVAIINSFDSEVDRPAFVFASGAMPTKTIAEAATHEAGHTFGLNHDGLCRNSACSNGNASEYYDGHGDWAPIMGRPISKPVTQWSQGEYARANNREDDLSKIAGYVGYRPDDHGGTTCSATVVAGTSTTSGFIGTTGETDVFAVDVGAGVLSATLRPPSGAGAWSNLLAQVTVRDGLGEIVGTGAPTVPTAWTASTSVNVTDGRYTVEVAPIGWKTAADGFTTYGSLGAYELSVTAPPASMIPPPPCRSTFTPITPTRLVDTRNGVGAPGRAVPGRQVVVQVAGSATVPSDATAAVVNVTAVEPSTAGFVTVYPCTDGVPDTSTLNYVSGQTVANTTIAALSSAGQLCVWTYADTDILVDITGWLGPSGTSRLTPINPTRVVDTRSSIGGIRLSAGSTMTVDLDGFAPGGSSAAALNVTAVNASAAGFLTVYPCGGGLPNTSTVNYVAREARPNNTIVGLGGGRVCIYTSAATDVLVDLVGSFGATGLGYQPTPPVRVLDTRRTATPGPGVAVGYAVGGAALAGQSPGAAYVNVTAANHVVPGFVTTYDCITRRDTSTINQQVGQVAANGAIVPLDALQSCAWTYGGGDVIVDLNGWWVP